MEGFILTESAEVARPKGNEESIYEHRGPSYTEVYTLKAGWHEWNEANYSVEAE